MQPIKYRQQTTFQIIIRNLSVSSSRALPFTLPPHPLICQQTFRQTASQTINPPSFRTSSIHPPPPPAYSQIDEAELGKEKTKTERRTKTTRPKNALFSAVTMLACSSVVVIKAGADCSGALFVKNQGRSRVYGGEKDYETGQAPSHLTGNGTNCFETLERVKGGGEPFHRFAEVSGGRGEQATAAALSLCWELSSKPCYLLLP